MFLDVPDEYETKYLLCCEHIKNVHLMVAKHVVRCLKGTVDYGLQYEVNQNINLEGYVDSDWVGSDIDRKRTFEHCFSIRSCVSYWFKKEVVLHGTEYSRERSSEAPICDPDQDLSKEGVLV